MASIPDECKLYRQRGGSRCFVLTLSSLRYAPRFPCAILKSPKCPTLDIGIAQPSNPAFSQSMVSLKLATFRGSFGPFKAVKIKGKSTIRRQFKHVTCSDDELGQYYFKDAAAARRAMAELGQRSWEYQFEFAAEMARRCAASMGDDKHMHQALDAYEDWLEKHPFSPARRFPILRNPTPLADLYPRAQRLVVSDQALKFALSYSSAYSQKTPLHRIAVDKSHQLGPDLLSLRQRTLEKIVPEALGDMDLWDWEHDREGRLVRVPSRLHLEWLCWAYTPDERGVLECAARDMANRLDCVL